MQTPILLHKNYTLNEEGYQLKLPLNLETIIQTLRRETYHPCEGLISGTFNGDYYIFYHNYFMFSKIQVSYGYHIQVFLPESVKFNSP